MHLLATEPGMIADGSAAIDLAQTPGDIVVLASADTEIALLATVRRGAWRRLWRYLAEGGPGNADNFLRYAASLLSGRTEWAEPAPLLRAGLYFPGRALPSLDEIIAEWRGKPAPAKAG